MFPPVGSKLIITYLGNGFWNVETHKGLLQTSAGDGLCHHEISQYFTEGEITECETCGVVPSKKKPSKKKRSKKCLYDEWPPWRD